MEYAKTLEDLPKVFKEALCALQAFTFLGYGPADCAVMPGPDGSSDLYVILISEKFGLSVGDRTSISADEKEIAAYWEHAKQLWFDAPVKECARIYVSSLVYEAREELGQLMEKAGCHPPMLADA
jgi:hypothetical protein